jgi:DNA-binding PadR family transcriptional regulator
MHLEEMHLTKEVFHVLLSLASETRHGYGIIRDVSDATGGTLVLRTGTLYNILKRLLDDALINESERRPGHDEDDERRRYYALTPIGRRALQAEAQRLEGMVGLARARRLLPRPAKGGGR